MSAFNILIAETACPKCGNRAKFEIQFKFGNTWQFKYSIGDALRWGGNDVGKPGSRKAVVEGAGGPCPICQSKHLDFEILVENDRIVSVAAASERIKAAKDGFILED